VSGLEGGAGRDVRKPPAPPRTGMAGRYGASPLHLLAHLALFATFLLIASLLFDDTQAWNIALWFVGAIVLHDLVLLPFYSALDRLAARGAPRGAVNFVRIPVALSGLLLLLFFPPILGRNDGSFARVAGEEPSGYLERWLLVTALLFAGSLALYLLRLARHGRDLPAQHA
jgi:Na+/melibiose symporter-like transporter